MGTDYDYPAVATPDDEEDQQKRLYNEMYPPVSAPAPAPSTPVPTAGYPAPQPAGAAPQAAPAPANDMPAPMPEARADFSGLGPPVSAQPAPQPPNWKDYAPKEKHGWGKFGSVMASLNPLSDRIVNQRPLANAERNYEAATNEFKEKEGQGKEASAEDLQKAQAENQRAEANAREHPPADWKNVPNLQGPNGEPIELNEKTGEHRYGNITGAKPIRQPGETQEQNKLAFQGVISKLDAAGLSTDPKTIDKSLDAALKQGKITPQEHAAARSYQAANTTPGTNLTVHVEGQQAGEDLKEKSGFYAYQGKIVRGSKLSEEQRANAIPVKNVEKADESIKGTNSVLSSFDRYESDLGRAKLTPDDVRALQVMTSPDRIAAGFLEKEGAGVLDTIFGEPLTGYSQKAMNGIMTKDQYDKLSPDGQKLLVGYFNALISNFADMKARLGTVGRNESMLQAEIHTIPLPYIGKDVAKEALDRKRSGVIERNIYYGEAPHASTGGGDKKQAYQKDGKWFDASTNQEIH